MLRQRYRSAEMEKRNRDCLQSVDRAMNVKVTLRIDILVPVFYSNDVVAGGTRKRENTVGGNTISLTCRTKSHWVCAINSDAPCSAGRIARGIQRKLNLERRIEANRCAQL